MWIQPVAPDDLAHPKQCEDCGAAIIWAKNEKGQAVAVNVGFKVRETLEFGDDGYLHLLTDEAAHSKTCEATWPARPSLTRSRRKKKHVGV